MNEVSMRSLGLLVLLTAAASAYSVDKYFYRCVPYLSDHGVVFKEATYLCDSYDGRRYVVAKDNNIDDVTYDTVVIRDGLRYPLTRTFPILGGIGGGGAGSAAQSSAGSLSGGIGGGILPFSVGGSISGAQSSAASNAGGGGLGFLG